MEFSVDEKGAKQSIRHKRRKERVWEAGKQTSAGGFHHPSRRIAPRCVCLRVYACVCVCDIETIDLEVCVGQKGGKHGDSALQEPAGGYRQLRQL